MATASRRCAPARSTEGTTSGGSLESGGLSIGPRIDEEGPFFITEAEREGVVDSFLDSVTEAMVDARTGELL